MKKKQIQLCVLYLEAVWKMVHMWAPPPPNRENRAGNYNKVKLYMPENVEENRQKNKGTETKKKIRRTEKEEQEEGQKGNYSNKEGE